MNNVLLNIILSTIKISNSVQATITDNILLMVLTLRVYTNTEEGESANNVRLVL